MKGEGVSRRGGGGIRGGGREGNGGRGRPPLVGFERVEVRTRLTRHFFSPRYFLLQKYIDVVRLSSARC